MHPLESIEKELWKIPEILIVVEGDSDVRALRSLGLEQTIVPLNQKPLYEIVEKVAKLGKEVALLVDLDREGKKIYRYLYHHLTRHGVKVDNHFREFLFRTPVRRIEELPGFLGRKGALLHIW